MVTFCLILISLWMMPFVALSSPYIVSSDQTEISVESNVEYIRSADSRLRPAEVIASSHDNTWQKLSDKGLSFGYTSDEFWFKITLANPTPNSIKKYFEIGSTTVDYLDFFVVQEGKIKETIQTGDHRPFLNRPLKTRSFVFPIDVPQKGQVTLYFRIHSQSSIYAPLKIWAPNTFREFEERVQIFIALSLGCMILIIGYNLFIYFSFRHLSYLYYSIFAVCSTVMQATIHGIGQKYFWRDFYWLNDQGGILFISATVFWLFLFSRSFLRIRREQKVVHYISLGLLCSSLLSMILCVISPTTPFVKLAVFHGFLGPIVVLGIAIKYALRRETSAMIFTIAWVALAGGSAAIALNRLGLIPKNTFTTYGQLIGTTIEMLLLSLALANRLNDLKSQLQSANAKLEVYIAKVEEIAEQKTRKIKSIFSHIQQGIFTVNEKLEVDKENSLYLYTMLGARKNDNRNFKKFFLDRTDLSNDRKGQIESVLKSSLAEDSLSFELNQHLLERSLKINDGAQGAITCELDWHTITDDQGRVERILVSVRDVTEMNNIVAEKEKNKEEMQKISEILQVEESAFSRFIRTSERLLSECRGLLSANHALSDDHLNLFFLHMHTMKGTCRSYNFGVLSDKCHSIEQYLSDLREHRASQDHQLLSEFVESISSDVMHYKIIAEEKLGRSSAGRFKVIAMANVESMIQSLKQFRSITPKSATLERIQADFESGLFPLFYCSVEAILDQVFSSSSKIAHNLNKYPPKVELINVAYGVDEVYEDLFQKVFVHLLRNSLAHGIETISERETKHKKPQGLITLRFEEIGDIMRISYQDDGRGFDLKTIFQTASKG